MRWLLDTNVVLRLLNPALPGHQQAADAVAGLLQNGDEPCLTAQNLIELWAVSTRPLAVNGLGLTPAEAKQNLTALRARFLLLADTPAVLAYWETLVVIHQIAGKKTHDARLVAVMLAHGITHLLTFNTGDFTSFTEITTTSPATMVQ